VRIVAAPAEQRRTTLELDDSKPQAGLGEIYEKQFVEQVRGLGFGVGRRRVGGSDGGREGLALP